MKTILATLAVLSLATLDPAIAETKKSKVQTTEKVESNAGATTQTGTADPSAPTDTSVDTTNNSSDKYERTEVVETETNDDDKKDAGFFLEPSILYETGEGKIDFKSIAQPDGDLKGAGVGLRLGSHFKDVFFIALDAAYSEPEFTDDNGNFDYDLKSWLAGVTVGLQTPVAGLRVWGGYVPFGEIKFEGRGSNDTTVKYKDPQLWKLGAGLRIKAISLNLEYLNGDYTKLQVENAGSLLSGSYDGDATRESWIASISFPLAL